MNPSVEELKDEKNYTLIEGVDFASTVPFLIRFLGKLNPVMAFYYVFILFLLIIIVYLNFYYIAYSDLNWNTVLKFSTLGFFLGAIPIIPFHELIHGLACKVLGAKKIRYGVEWSYMMFYAAADNFVMNRKQFVFVALSPFILISVVFISTALMSDHLYALMWLSACFFHGTMCIGDFGLLSFYNENRGKEIYTYDSTGEKKSYFYQKSQFGLN